MALHIIAAVIIGGLHSWPHWVQMFLTISCCRNFVLHACTTYLSHIKPLHYQDIRYVHQHWLLWSFYADHSATGLLDVLLQWLTYSFVEWLHGSKTLDQSKCSAPSEARHSSVLFFYLEGQLASASPRTQAPTVAPSVLFPIQPGALLRH